MFLRMAIGDIFVLRRGSVHLLYIDRSSNNIGTMPRISIDLRQLQTLMCRACTSREFFWHTRFVSPSSKFMGLPLPVLVRIRLYDSTTSFILRYSFFNSLGLSHHFLAGFVQVLVSF
jgi:hypothetical protein